jgi:hypothetical protein
MWLDRPDAEEQDAFRRNQVRALVLGLFGAVIRILILRKTGNGWARIGIGQYSAFTKDQYYWVRMFEAVEKMYFQTLEKYRRRTIRLA